MQPDLMVLNGLFSDSNVTRLGFIFCPEMELERNIRAYANDQLIFDPRTRIIWAW